MPLRLEGKVAVITGAAHGIGKASARAFAAEGAMVVAVDLDEEGLERLPYLEGDFCNRISTVVADVTEESGAVRITQQALDKFGRIDILYNNVGGSGARIRFHELSLDQWEGILRLNLRSVFLMCRQVLPVMVAQRGGVVINTASQMGLVGAAGLAAYNTAKAGIINLTRSLAAEYGSLGIRVNCLCPGATETSSLAKDFAGAPDPGAARQDWLGHHLLKRFADPREIAKAALFLASDESSFVTGCCLVVDGGFTAV